MIIDGHMYCFPQFDSPGDYETLGEKMRYIQRELSGHHQPVWRVRDRAPADNSTLADPVTSELRDVKWTRHLGRLAWVYRGETYTKQYLPPMLHNLECPPELMVAEMDYIGVDMGIIHTYPTFGLINGFLRDAVARFPDRLMRLISFREDNLPHDPDSAIGELESEAQAGGRQGLQFHSNFYYGAGHTEPWDGGAMRPFWEAVAGLRLPVFFTLGARSGFRYDRAAQESYLEEHDILLRWMDRYPDSTVVITHGLQWRTFLQGERISFPESIWDVFKAPQCHLQLLFPIQLGNIWEYPWRETEPVVKEIAERVGARRLMWGTDMPMVARFCTYRQTLDQFRVHCRFLTGAERSDILGGTAARVMGL